MRKARQTTPEERLEIVRECLANDIRAIIVFFACRSGASAITPPVRGRLAAVSRTKRC